MKTGMLWFDNDPKTDLHGKVERAAAYYQSKYGRFPNLCFVHPSLLQQATGDLGDIDIRPSQRILPNHLWLGFSD